jgi:hypothetical protein
MTKTSLLLLISLLAFRPSYAQLDSLVDVFPLAVGNQWTYGYYRGYEGGLQWWYVDTGSVNATVTGMNPTADSTRWLFHETYDIITHVYPVGTTYRTIDSSDYWITEYHSGRHHLINTAGCCTRIFHFSPLRTLQTLYQGTKLSIRVAMFEL